ncbi:pyocin knob domain-containing protein [Lacticaseibacillus hulanensis]|uniref:pyocin knob domain-containing protein n=1 Tax=Lacticaseibacillus hulanensis TaxID=2493111 RepID=UPI000FD821F6|nr:pyocin knob domain-containing protein [Lacticaseibacillus hulanensis]
MPKSYFTAAALALMAQVQSGQTQIKFTRGAASTDNWSAKTKEELAATTVLTNIAQETTIGKAEVVTRSDGTMSTDSIVIDVVFDESKTTKEFNMYTLGLYACPTDGSKDGAEILYSITTLEDPQFMAPDDNGSSQTFRLTTAIGDVANLSIKLDGDNTGGLDQVALEALHQKITAETVKTVAGGTVVHTDGDETVDGVKTFSKTIIGRVQHADNADAAGKLDHSIKVNGVATDLSKDFTVNAFPSNDADLGHLSKDNVWAGLATFAKQVTGTITEALHAAKATLADTATKWTKAIKINGVDVDGSKDVTITDASAVHLTGDQTVAGVKTFSSTIKGKIDSATNADHATSADSATKATTADNAAKAGEATTTTGNAATATKLATARKVNGVAFDGTADINIVDAGAPRKTDVMPYVRNLTSGEDLNKITQHGYYGANSIPLTNGPIANSGKHYGMLVVTGQDPFSTTSGITNVTQTFYNIGDIYVRGYFGPPTWGGWNRVALTSDLAPYAKTSDVANGYLAKSGNAVSATKLVTARKINGVSFDGTGDVTITAMPSNDSSILHTGDSKTLTGTLTFSKPITIAGNDTVGQRTVLIQQSSATDGGYLAVGNTGADAGYVELGAIDNANTTIYARKRGTNNAVVSEATLLDSSNNTKFPGTVTAPTFSGTLNGKASSAANADHATKADSATSATTAANATNAAHATKADSATSATSATNATNAGAATKLATARKISGVPFDGTADISLFVMCTSEADAKTKSAADPTRIYWYPES